MSDVERASNVGRWCGDDEGLFGVVRVGLGRLCRLEVVALLPPLVPALFDVQRVVSALHGLGEVFLFTGNGVVDPFRLLLDLLLGLLLLWCAGAGGVLCGLVALERILGGLLGLLSASLAAFFMALLVMG